jgi:hypothetical protein
MNRKWWKIEQNDKSFKTLQCSHSQKHGKRLFMLIKNQTKSKNGEDFNVCEFHKTMNFLNTKFWCTHSFCDEQQHDTKLHAPFGHNVKIWCHVKHYG